MSSGGFKLCCGFIIFDWLEVAALCFSPTFGLVVAAPLQLWCWMICNSDPVPISFTHTHPHQRCACGRVTWQSPQCTLFTQQLLTIYWALPFVYVPVMIRHSFRWQGKKGERKRVWERRGWCQKWNEAMHSAQSHWHVSARWQSAQFLYPSLVHPVCYFWYFWITSPMGSCWVWLSHVDTHSPAVSQLWMQLMLSLSAIYTCIQVTPFLHNVMVVCQWRLWHITQNHKCQLYDRLLKPL